MAPHVNQSVEQRNDKTRFRSKLRQTQIIFLPDALNMLSKKTSLDLIAAVVPEIAASFFAMEPQTMANISGVPNRT